MPKNQEIALQGVRIKGNLAGLFGCYEVTQEFSNPLDEAVEIVCSFPLPKDASVNRFRVDLGGFQIDSTIMEKEEAFDFYSESIRQGDAGVLVEQHRADIFQLSFGSLEPKEKALVTLFFTAPVECVDQALSLRFPTVIAPRYIPGVVKGKRRGLGTHAPTDVVPDADHITPPVGDVVYPLQFDLEIAPPGAIKKFSSPSHTLQVTQKNGTYHVSLQDAALDGDVVIYGALEKEQSALGFVDSLEEPRFVQVTFIPDLGGLTEERIYRDYVFLLDTSGSMGGTKLKQAVDALSMCLRYLEKGDGLEIIEFHSSMKSYFHGLVPFDSTSLRKAEEKLKRARATGGTEILAPLKRATELASNREKVIVLLTDGQVGNEKEIIQHVRGQENLRVFTIGVDTAVNESFLTKLADVGRGRSEYIYPGERVDEKIIRQFAGISSPLVEDVSLDWGSLNVLDVCPVRMPRIFDQEPVTVLARVTSGTPSAITLRGSVGPHTLEEVIPLSEIRAVPSLVIKQAWAKKQIAALEESIASANPRRRQTIERAINELSKEYSVVSTVTSLVARYDREGKGSTTPTFHVTPVMLPRQWEQPDMPSSNFYSLGFGIGEPRLSESNPLSMLRTFTPLGRYSVESSQERESPLRTLVRMSNEEGSFGSTSENALAVLAIVSEEREALVYSKIIKRTLRLLESSLAQERLERYEEFVVILALKIAAQEGLLSLKPETRMRFEGVFAPYQEYLQKEGMLGLTDAIGDGIVHLRGGGKVMKQVRELLAVFS